MVLAEIGAWELLIILAVIIVLFGGTKIPQLARSIGQAKKEFEAGQADADEGDAKKG